MKINATSSSQSQTVTYDYSSSKKMSDDMSDASVQNSGDSFDSASLVKVAAGKENEEEPINDELLKKSVDQANKALLMYNKYIEREVHSVTHTVMYKLKDSRTNEVIQEFPPKKIQDMIAKMWEMAGLFVDKKL